MNVRVPFPLFALLLEDAAGVVLFTNPPLCVLPLFTSHDEIDLFQRRHLPKCQTLIIDNPEILKSILQARAEPRQQSSGESYRVIFDPIEMFVSDDMISLSREELIAACAHLTG